MNSHHRSNNSYKNSVYNPFAERPMQSTLLQSRVQPLIYKDRGGYLERDKPTKENTQCNMFDKIRDPLKKSQFSNKVLMNAKPAYGKNDHCTKVIPPRLPCSTTIRTDSTQQLQKSSRTRKDGSRSHNRLIPNKKADFNFYKQRQQQPSSYVSNCQTFYSQVGAPMRREQQKPHFNANYIGQRVQRTEIMVKSRIQKQGYREETKTQIKIEAKKNLKMTKHYKQNVISQSQFECHQEMSPKRRPSTVKSRFKKVPSPINLTPEEQIKRFEEIEAEIQKNFDSDCIVQMINREAEYQSITHFSNYLDLRQRHINWIKRAVLINWMMEFMVDYGGRRQTLNIAVSIVDRYLCSIEHCPLNRLQLVGITSLYIASKLEQTNRPALSSFAESISEVFSQQDIMDEQVNILVCLKYELNSPTLHSWCLRLTIQWDLYLKTTNDQFSTKFSQLIHFKNSDQKSYYNYRWLVQLLDFAILDIHTLRYKNRALVASFIYLILGLRTQQFKQNDVITEFPSSSQYLVDKQVTLNQTFNKFLSFSFNILLCDLHPTIQYCASYFILPLTFQLPQKVKEEGKEIGYEQFCSYQTLNKHNIYCLQKRNRDFD